MGVAWGGQGRDASPRAAPGRPSTLANPNPNPNPNQAPVLLAPAAVVVLLGLGAVPAIVHPVRAPRALIGLGAA